MTAQTMPSLRDRAIAQAEADARAAEEREAKRTAQQKQISVEGFRQKLRKILQLDVDADRIGIENDAPIFCIEEGLVVSWRRTRFSESDYDRDLHVAVACSRCGNPVWESFNSLSSLGCELATETHYHSHDCLVQYDEDGNPTTDRSGNPLPPRGSFSLTVPPKEPVTLFAEAFTALERRVAALEDQ